MKKIMKRIIAVAVVCVMMLSITALAAEPRASAYISYKGGGILAKGNGYMKIEFSMTATGMMDVLGACEINIYNVDDERNPVKTFEYTDAGCGGMMTTDDFGHDGEVYWQGVSGETYYAIITFYAEDSTGYDYRSFLTTETTV